MINLTSLKIKALSLRQRTAKHIINKKQLKRIQISWCSIMYCLWTVSMNAITIVQLGGAICHTAVSVKRSKTQTFKTFVQTELTLLCGNLRIFPRRIKGHIFNSRQMVHNLREKLIFWTHCILKCVLFHYIKC